MVPLNHGSTECSKEGSMARVISIAGTKGGVGKSTTAYILAVRLADMGHKVGLLDADPNHAVSDWHAVGQIPSITVVGGITEMNLGDEVAKLEDGGTDFIVIDLPGMRGMVQVFAFGLSDLIIIPTQTSRPDVEQALALLNMIERNRKTIQTAKVRLMWTRISPSYTTGVDAHAFAQVAEHDAPVLAARLYERKHFKEMTYTGKLPVLDGPKLTNSDREAVANIDAIVSEVLAVLQVDTVPP
jgi:chromosome partitioning protein